MQPEPSQATSILSSKWSAGSRQGRQGYSNWPFNVTLAAVLVITVVLRSAGLSHRPWLSVVRLATGVGLILAWIVISLVPYVQPRGLKNLLRSSELSPSHFVHITEKGAAVIATSGIVMHCKTATGFAWLLTETKQDWLVQGIFSDGINCCLLLVLFSEDNRLFACHQNVTIAYDDNMLPTGFKATKVYVAYDPDRVDGESLKAALVFAQRQVEDVNIFVFDCITHQTCGVGIDHMFYRLNANVRFNRITMRPTVATVKNVLHGIRMHGFYERRTYNNADIDSTQFDTQFVVSAFVPHRTQTFDLQPVICPDGDKKSLYFAYQATSVVSLPNRRSGVDRTIRDRGRKPYEVQKSH